eukprot:GFUD01007344.1.p1 GENE.GFUD01007344.1~~GFUD01007344.1.p1  ORF type:complete len:236 (-),score=83.82 GFUD01007344.1:120-788(-)
MSSKTALLLGGTGETGKEVLKLLVSTPVYGKVVCLGRRVVDLPKGEGWDRVEQKLVDYDNLSQYGDSFTGADSAFCCLGTTRGKAGKEGFIKVDHDYVLEAAKLLKAANCPDFHLLTSKGSNMDSWFLYPGTKGKVEEAVKQVEFPRLTIYRPGLLKCDRQEGRTGEGLIRWIAEMTDKANSWSIPTSMVAQAMVATSLTPPIPGVEVMEHSSLVKVVNEAL